MITKRRRIMTILILSILIVVAGYFFVGFPKKNTATYGITWSTTYADALGIDAQKGLEAAMDELKFTLIRIPVYWTDVEPSRGSFRWNVYDRELDAIEQRGGKAVLVLGAKQPRWPEWWIPTWVTDLTPEQQQEAQLAYVKAAYEHFSPRRSVKAWQVENESQLAFGEGEIQSKAFTRKEMDLVRGFERQRPQETRRPVYTTESGELSLWFGFAGHVDGIGVSVYRIVRNAYLGILHYPTPPIFYRRKANLVERWTGPLYVSEFQMEPWTVDLIQNTRLDEQEKSFDLEQMRSNLAYGEKLAFPEIYFWGAEWWYWMKEKNGHAEYWDMMKAFMANR